MTQFFTSKKSSAITTVGLTPVKSSRQPNRSKHSTADFKGKSSS